MSTYTCGLDLGQSVDFSVLTAVERIPREREPARYVLRWLERFPLGQAYTTTADLISQRMKSEVLRGSRLVIDAGGPGRPVYDIFLRKGIPASLVPVTITGGRTVNATTTGLTVPKSHLVSVLVALFQEGRLQFAKIEGIETLVAELKAFKVRQTATAHETFAGDKDHDDTVVSLALACWYAEKGAGFVAPPVVQRKERQIDVTRPVGVDQALLRGQEDGLTRRRLFGR